MEYVHVIGCMPVVACTNIDDLEDDVDALKKRVTAPRNTST